MQFELDFLQSLQSIRTPALDSIMKFITRFGDKGIFWILLGLLLFAIPKTRRIGFVVCASEGVNVVICNGLLKNIVRRIRPYEVNPSVELIVKKPDDFSFPSGHTSIGFAVVAAFLLLGITWAWVASLIFSCLIGFSRLYLHVHYPTDVIGGAILGFICGYIGYRIAKAILAYLDKRKAAGKTR